LDRRRTEYAVGAPQSPADDLKRRAQAQPAKKEVKVSDGNVQSTAPPRMMAYGNCGSRRSGGAPGWEKFIQARRPLLSADQDATPALYVLIKSGALPAHSRIRARRGTILVPTATVCSKAQSRASEPASRRDYS
jgi:hypothetical protein